MERIVKETTGPDNKNLKVIINIGKKIGCNHASLSDNPWVTNKSVRFRRNVQSLMEETNTKGDQGNKKNLTFKEPAWSSVVCLSLPLILWL